MGKDSEYKFSYTRGTGPGGQHKNKVESCVVVTHVPTGITERCEETRSQFKNKKLALQRIKIKLDILSKEVKNEVLNKQRKEIIKERIRTYNYKTGLVKDHRTNKTAPLNKVLDGNLDLLK